MGFLRKTFYTLIALPTAAIGAEYFYTRRCVEVNPTDRLAKRCPLVARRLAENATRLDRFERAVPIASLKAGVDSLDEESLSRKLAKQMWLTRAYTPQRVICERIFKSKKDPEANLTTEELNKGKIRLGYDVSQLFVVTDITGSYIQFEPKVPATVDFKGPGGLVCVDVSRRGENVVFAIECAIIGVRTNGPLGLGDALHFWLHKIYSRLLLEGGVRRVLYGGNE